MPTITVNGYPLPPPKRGYRPTVTTVVDAARNAAGVVVGQRIGRDQYKLDNIEWPWLTAYEWQYVLMVLAPFFVSVNFTNPVTGTMTTCPMYCGDRSAEPYWVDSNGQPLYYRSCKANLIDTGYGNV